MPDTNLLNDQALNNSRGQQTIVKGIADEISKVTIQLKDQQKTVRNITDEYDKMSKEQDEIVKKLVSQKKVQDELNSVSGDEAKTQEVYNKYIQAGIDLLKTRAQNLADLNTAEENALERKKQKEFEYQKIVNERKELLEQITDLQIKEKTESLSDEERAKLQIAKGEFEVRKDMLKQLQKEQQRLDEEYWEYHTKSAEDAEKAISQKRRKWQAEEDIESAKRQESYFRKRLKESKTEEDKKENRERLKEWKKVRENLQRQDDIQSQVESGKIGMAFGSQQQFGLSIKGIGGNQLLGGAGILKDLADFADQTINKAISGMAKELNSVVDIATNLVSQYQARMDYRLGLGRFDAAWNTVQGTIGNSGIISQQKLIEKIGEAVDKGIAYNVEQRAFLQTVSDNIQSTFDAFDSNLMRIIRIQQADSTVQRLGMEKALNDLLNDYFQDSSYLNTLYDSVSEALFETTASQGSRQQAVETEFIVQKWLGSLYSLGASSNVINQIAQGIGYLGSGNVQALAGNAPLQTILAMSSSRAGLDYASLLTSGLNAENTNRLLKAMVDYLAEIADSTSENNVVRSAFGNVFGMAVSDIRSFQNLASSTNEIYNEILDYNGAGEYAQNQLSQYESYLGTAQYYKNMLDNIKLSIGKTYADGAGYVAYKVIDIIDDLTNGGPEFSLKLFGSGISFKTFDLIKSGMFGVGLISSLVNNGLGNNSALDLKNWGYSDVVTRGTGFGLRGVTSGTSFSTTVGNASSSDVEKETLKEGQEKAKQVKSETGETEEEETLKGIYHGLINPGEKAKLTSLVTKAEDVNNNMKKAYDLLKQTSSEGSKRSFNVNIKSINGQDVEKGVLKTSPDDQWKTLIRGAAVLIKYGQLLNGFDDQFLKRIAAEAEGNQEQYTLQDLIDLMVPQLESEEGLPVRLESVDSMTNLMADLRNR